MLLHFYGSSISGWCWVQCSDARFRPGGSGGGELWMYYHVESDGTCHHLNMVNTIRLVFDSDVEPGWRHVQTQPEVVEVSLWRVIKRVTPLLFWGFGHIRPGSAENLQDCRCSNLDWTILQSIKINWNTVSDLINLYSIHENAYKAYLFIPVLVTPRPYRVSSRKQNPPMWTSLWSPPLSPCCHWWWINWLTTLLT